MYSRHLEAKSAIMNGSEQYTPVAANPKRLQRTADAAR
jgi:hypothetical protein